MNKKRSLLILVVNIFLIMILGVGGVIAVSGVNVGITGTIGDLSDEVVLMTQESGAGDYEDPYDLPERTSPSGESSFYSTVSGTTFSIDTWADAPRENIALTYDIPTGTSGDLEITWGDISSGADYEASLTITGAVTGLNMKSDIDNTYIYENAGDGDDISIYITFTNVAEDGAPPGPGGGGPGGGGGGGSPPKGEDIFIKNKFMDVFIGINVLDGVGLVKTKNIDLFNEANEPIPVKITIPGNLKDLLFISEDDLSFVLGGGG